MVGDIGAGSNGVREHNAVEAKGSHKDAADTAQESSGNGPGNEKDMQTQNGAGSEVFGLYELADDGTILYSRPRAADGLHEAEHGIVGRDFFRDVFPCRNIDDLRRHFRRFITEARPVDTFVFDGLFEEEIVRAKIFMTRAYENDHDHAGGIVIMDIRRAV